MSEGPEENGASEPTMRYIIFCGEMVRADVRHVASLLLPIPVSAKGDR